MALPVEQAAAPLHVWEGLCQLRHSLFSSLHFLTRLGSVMLFLQPHLSCLFFFFFAFFSAVSMLLILPVGSAGASRGISKQLVLVVTQGLNAAVRTLFFTPLGAPGRETGIFGCILEGLDPISSPNCCFPFPGVKCIPGAGGSFHFGPMDLASRPTLGT